MTITNEFILGDLMQYMIDNQLDILEELEYGNTDVIVDMIAMGNKCTEDKAIEIFQNLQQRYELTEIIKCLGQEIIGCETDETADDVDRNKYDSYLEILEDIYSGIQVADDNLSFNEFKKLSTRYVYKYAEGIKKRYISKFNNSMEMNQIYIGMLMSALAGELKEPIKLNDDGTVHKKSLKESFKERKRQRGGVSHGK